MFRRRSFLVRVISCQALGGLPFVVLSITRRLIHCPCLALPTLARRQHSAVVGELDEDIDAQLDLSSIKAEPLLPVIH